MARSLSVRDGVVRLIGAGKLKSLLAGEAQEAVASTYVGCSPYIRRRPATGRRTKDIVPK
jgi:hypothetical protein